MTWQEGIRTFCAANITTDISRSRALYSSFSSRPAGVWFEWNPKKVVWNSFHLQCWQLFLLHTHVQAFIPISPCCLFPLILSVFPTSQRISFMTQCTNKFSRTGPQGGTWCMESREKQGTQSKAASVMPPKCGFPNSLFFPSSHPKFYSYKWKKPCKKKPF